MFKRFFPGDDMIRFWKVAALVALATIPIVLITKKKADDRKTRVANADAVDMFERELSAE
jgi:hypothetical protein